MNLQLLRVVRTISAALVLFVFGAALGYSSSSAYTNQVLFNFNNAPNGSYPLSGVVADSAGNLYGVATGTAFPGQGWGTASGVVYKLAPGGAGKWTESVIYQFTGDPATGPDGAEPVGRLVMDATGSLYGTTEFGGVYGCGTVFQLAPSGQTWKETVLHSFVCYPNDGARPVAGLLLDQQGNLYGATTRGGTGMCGDFNPFIIFGCGVVFEISPGANQAWIEKVLYNFDGITAWDSASNLLLDRSGNLYGAAEFGGMGVCYNGIYGGCGAIFELQPAGNGLWTETTLYQFSGGSDTGVPSGQIAMDTAGNLFGSGLGGSGGIDSIFELSPGTGGSWTERILFTGFVSCSGVTLDSSGNLFGTAYDSSSYFIFEISPLPGGGWSNQKIYNFAGGLDGLNSVAQVFADAGGNLFTPSLCSGTTCLGSVLELTPGAAGRYTSTVIYDFPYSVDGGKPMASLLPDGSGNYYGNTQYGGIYGNGTIFELTPSGNGKFAKTILYSFTGTAGDGALPVGNLTLDAQGNLYGATLRGGTFLIGTVFKLTPSKAGIWTETVLHSFAGTTQGDGQYPNGGMVFDKSGNLNGSTLQGGGTGFGPGCGTVFQLQPDGKGGFTEKVIYAFLGTTHTAVGPNSGLAIDAQGNLYGTTLTSSSYPYDAYVFRLNQSGGAWVETLLFDLGYSGGSPGSPILDSLGNLYNTTVGGGSYARGSAYKLTPTSTGYWTQTVLHNFTLVNGDGGYPLGGMVFDSAGNLYGTTYSGGTNSGGCGGYGCGTIFRLKPTAKGQWSERILHRFNSPTTDGSEPYGGVVLDSAGDIFGTTTYGGSGGQGTLFEVKP